MHGCIDVPDPRTVQPNRPHARKQKQKSGRKFANKWDTYDVDGELARLDAEEEREAAGGNGGHALLPRRRRGAGGKATLGRVRTEIGQLNHDLEKLMGYLDQVRCVAGCRGLCVSAWYGLFRWCQHRRPLTVGCVE